VQNPEFTSNSDMVTMEKEMGQQMKYDIFDIFANVKARNVAYIF
jgi:hypothetical protein